MQGMHAIEKATYANAIHEWVIVPLQGLEHKRHYLCVAKALRLSLRRETVKMTDSTIINRFDEIIARSATPEDSETSSDEGDCKHMVSGYATA